jgi:hypothetical protein
MIINTYLCIYTYVCLYIYVYLYTYLYMHIYILTESKERLNKNLKDTFTRFCDEHGINFMTFCIILEDFKTSLFSSKIQIFFKNVTTRINKSVKKKRKKVMINKCNKLIQIFHF